MKKLNTQSQQQSQFIVEYDWKLGDEGFSAQFQVEKIAGHWNTSESFSLKNQNRNWGLWEYDVCEIFLQAREKQNQFTSPYLEIQISPLNQGFSLLVIKPREIMALPLCEQFRSVSHFEESTWTVEIFMDFKELALNFQGAHLYAGFFSCLGKKREYFAHFDQRQEKPDFHKPNLFQPLF
ncbi:MAG: hypothetical protein H6621_02225 [Halobacteriovoraceae bacterium]|nr:hypothetical protein [Halobacteriovoraceae bacterium]MCB9093860.1 hypothetical protein [Halobacteriovoraceae bacterium]